MASTPLDLHKKSWQDISLAEFYEVNDILASDLEPLLKYAGIISILYRTPLKEVQSFDLIEFNRCVQSLKFIEKEVQAVKIPESLTINGRLFHVNREVSKLTASQYIDFLNHAKNGGIGNIHHILALFVWPCKVENGMLGKRYKRIEADANEVAEYLNQHMSVVDAYSMQVFFSIVWKRLTQAIQTSLRWQMRTVSMQIRGRKALGMKVSKTLTDGYAQLKEWQKQLEERGMLYMS